MDGIMKFDARTNHDPEQRTAFIEWLVAEAVSGLQRSAGDAEALRAVVFLYLSRGYEAGLGADEICDLLGVTHGNVLSKAKLAQPDQQVVLDAFEVLDPIVEGTYSSR